MLVAAAIGGTLYFRSRQAMARLTDKDTIVLSDFDNKTGDSGIRRHAEAGTLGAA